MTTDAHPRLAFPKPWRYLNRVQAIDPAAVYVPPGEGGNGDHIKLSPRFGGGCLPNPDRAEEWIRYPAEPTYPRPVTDQPALDPAIKRSWRQALGVPCRECPEGAAV
jgi:hypothetical protein